MGLTNISKALCLRCRLPSNKSPSQISGHVTTVTCSTNVTVSSGSDRDFVANLRLRLPAAGGLCGSAGFQLTLLRSKVCPGSDFYFGCLGRVTVNPAKLGVECWPASIGQVCTFLPWWPSPSPNLLARKSAAVVQSVSPALRNRTSQPEHELTNSRPHFRQKNTPLLHLIKTTVLWIALQ